MKLKTVIYHVTLLVEILSWLTMVPMVETGHHRKSHGSEHISGSYYPAAGRWKFMARLKIRRKNATDTSLCSAIMISDHSLLTAAHCLNRNVESIVVVLTEVLVRNSPVHFFTGDYIIHPMSIPNVTRAFDIGIVKLPDKKVFRYVQEFEKIPLHRPSKARGYSYNPEDCHILGYGQEHPPTDKRVLQQAKIPILPKKYCKQMISNWKPEYEVCLGYDRKYTNKDVPKSGLQGDSGGAIICKTRRLARPPSERHTKIPKYSLVAVTVGLTDLSKLFRSTRRVFTAGVRIDAHLQWILDNM